MIKLLLSLQDPELDNDELQEETQEVLAALEDLELVEEANLVEEAAPEGSKALGGFLLGVLGAEVSSENVKKLFAFLADRLGDKQLKLNLETPDGRKLNLEAQSREEMDYLFDKAKDWANMSGEASEG